MSPLQPLTLAGLLELLRETPQLVHWIALAAGLGAGAVALAIAALPALRRVALRQIAYTRLSDFLPFHDVLEDGSALRSPDGDLTVTIALDGLDPGSMPYADRMALARRRKQWVDSLAGRGVRVKAMSRRSRLGILHEPLDPHPVRAEILRRQHAPFANAFSNTHHLVLTIEGGQDRARDKLAELVDQTLQILEPFRPRVVAHDGPPLPVDGLRSSALATFWGRVVNPLLDEPVPTAHDALRRRLASCNVQIDTASGLIEVSDGERMLYAQIVSPSDWGQKTQEALVARLLAVPCELLVLQLFAPAGRAEGELRVSRRADMVQGGRQLAVIDEQAELARNLVAGGATDQATFVDYGLSVFVYGDSPEVVRQGVADVRRAFIEFAIAPVIETDAAEYIWFRQLPTYEDHPREMGFFSHNLADLLSFETVTAGFGRSDWGDRAVLLMPTVQDTPYRFTFHDSEEDEGLGHMLFFGKPGKGKTSLACLLATGALDANEKLRVFFFDRGRGALVWTLAAGGKYLTLQDPQPGLPAASLNPLLRPATPENEAHLRNWLRMLTGIEGDPETEEQYGLFLANWHASAPENRRLDVLVQASFPDGSRARDEMRKWIDPHQYGRVYNGAADACDFGSSRIVTIDMSTCLEDAVLAPGLVLDLFHLIRSTMRAERCPALIIIDETIALLRQPLFLKRYLEILQEIRKAHGVVVSMFQRPNALGDIDPKLATSLRNLTATLGFMRDEGADVSDYDSWQLVDREKRFIKGQLAIAARHDRAMLIKKQAINESVYVNIHNGRLGDHAAFFKSGSDYAGAALDVAAECGGDLGAFPRRFLDRVAEDPARALRLRRAA